MSHKTVAAVTNPSRDFRGSGFRTQYCGYTHSGGHFGDCKRILVYSKQFMDRHQTLLRAHVEVRQRDKNSQDKRKARRLARLAQPMQAFLPPREKTTALVRLYLDTIEQCYHILHIPTFDRDFEALWSKDMSEAKPSFVALVLLMCATVNCCSEQDPQGFQGSNSIDRNTAANWIERVELWLGEHSQKHVTLLYYQLRCVLMLARFLTDVKAKRWWRESGDLYRFAVSAGLHLDTVTVRPGGKISLFESEMRRRIWAAIENIEMHTTFHRGVIPCMSVSEVDCGPPTNTPDEQLKDDMASIPLPLKQSHYTPSSPLIAAHGTHEVRKDVCGFLNSPHSLGMTQPELISWEEKLLTALKSIPQWPDAGKCSNLQLGKLDALPRALQRSELLEMLLLLHERALQSPATKTFCHYSRQGRLSAAASIIAAYDSLSKPAKVILVGMRGDVFEAAMRLCLDVCETGPQGGDDLITMPGRPSPQDICMLIERGLDMLQLRAERITGSLKRYWLLGCALSYVRRLIDPDRADQHEPNMANRLGGLLYKQLSLQLDPDTGEPPSTSPANYLNTPPAGKMPLDTPDSTAHDIAHSNWESAFNFEDMPLWESVLANLDVEDFVGF